MSGLELCRKVRERRFLGYIYFILVTAHRGERDAIEGLNSGADDFVTKPYDPAELCVRIRTGERLLALDSRDVTIFALAKLADSRDPETGAHLERMREYSRVLADFLSQQPKFGDEIDGNYIETLYQTSPLHDIGKVGIRDSILRKPGRLTPEEFEEMKSHSTIGAATLEAALRKHPEARFLQMAWEIALTHHEKYDGSGYPQGLKGDEIPLCGRIVALADVYDALTTKRVYKDAYPHEKARDIIVEGRGTHFDPDLVDAFLATQGLFLAIHRGLSNTVDEGQYPPREHSVPVYDDTTAAVTQN